MTALPHGWTLARLGDVCQRATKWDPRAEPQTDFEYIDIGAIDAQRIRGTKQLLGADAPSRARQIVRAGDTLLSTVRTYLVNTALVPPELDGATASTGFCVLHPSEAIDARFLFYSVIDARFVEALSRLQTGSSYPAVRDRDVLDQLIPLPPLAEQRRIVAAIEEHLSRLNGAVAALQSASARIDALIRRVRDEIAHLDGDVVRTGDVADVQGGIQKQPRRRPLKNRFPFLRVANVRRGELDLSEVHEIELFDGELERLALRAGDLLVVEGNGSPDQIGRCAVWRGEITNCVHQNHLIRVRPGPRLDPDYLGAFWNAPSTAKVISGVASSTSGLYTLSTTKVKAVPIVVPPLEQQRRAVAGLDEAMSSIATLQKEVQTARRRADSLRTAVLARALHGELVPQDPNDEPASVLLDRIAAERAAAPTPTRKRRVRTPV